MRVMIWAWESADLKQCLTYAEARWRQTKISDAGGVAVEKHDEDGHFKHDWSKHGQKQEEVVGRDWSRHVGHVPRQEKSEATAE